MPAPGLPVEAELLHKVFQALRPYGGVACLPLPHNQQETFTRLLARAVPAQSKPLEKLRKRWWDESHGDEDLGKPDLAAMFGGALGGASAGDSEALDPATIKLLEEALRAMQGQ